MQAKQEYRREAVNRKKALDLYVKNVMVPSLATWEAVDEEDRKENLQDKKSLTEYLGE